MQRVHQTLNPSTDHLHRVPRQGNGEATAALQALVNRTVAEISSAPLAVASSEGPGGTERLRLDVIERRRILAEAGHTAGHLGVAALRAGDAVTAGRAAEILVSYLQLISSSSRSLCRCRTTSIQ